MSESRLFVGNLAYQTMENDLQEYFSQAGVVTSVNLMLDKFTGKSRGFAFVEYSTPQEATKAVEMFHSKDFQGRALTVNIARPKEERPPRPGGGGGYRGDRGDRGERRERR
jgi:RNA recognition motif-containing protein